MEYRRLLTTVSNLTGLAMGEARMAARNTVDALVCSLDEAGRRRLSAALPAELAANVPAEQGNGQDVVREVALRCRRTPREARLWTGAVLTAFAEQDSELVDALRLPADIRDLVAHQDGGGDRTRP